MFKEKRRSISWRKLILAYFVVLLVGGVTPLLVSAEPSDLPPRRTPTPTISKTRGGFIELRADPLRGGLWTRIQWQDAFGDWRHIDGWQGAFIEGEGLVRWYVGEELLGAGPFRWLVYERKGGDLLAASDPFYLPERSDQTVEVEVSLSNSEPSIPAPTAEPAQPETLYVVQAGDTLSKIAHQFHTSVAALAAVNNIKNIDLIFVGQKLVVPAG